ncbi:hypothetical protein JWG44_10725 [Leptospira sp. 201903071]|uniref:RHS repeat-associated core domain-containing protein n=1 Tax=Leptospira ainazelensis TaxID=2810034 RepID=UPI0019657F4D|nr:RHS repeat-associated core domain-containing protein [Leptospira ainazelensis]MBM9500719.1 hypothetical protein [Leptospira ainazelensis]
MKSRGLRILTLCFVILFVLNFSLIRSVQNFFNTLATAFASSIPQKLPILQAGPDGSANTQYEIELPPGTKDITPRLSLSYNSNGRNGLVGMGWDLNGLHTISRNPSYGISYNGFDQYVSTLAGELIDVSGNKTKYHSRKESWILFEPQGTCGDGPCSWVATDKSGRKFFFGASLDSRIPALGRTAGSIREWTLNREEDGHGNGYDIQYSSIDVSNGDSYPESITYNDRIIRFIFENRNDKTPNYILGTLERIQKRLDKIEISVGGNVFRTYDLDYSYGPGTGRSILRKIKRSGNNTFGTESFDDIDFTYTNQAGSFSIGSLDYQVFTDTTTMNVFIPNIAVDFLNVFFNTSLPYHPSALDTNIDASLQYVVKVPVPDRNACNLGLASCLCALLVPCWGGNQGFFEYLAGNCAGFLGWGGPDACVNGVNSALTAWLPMDLNGDGISDFVAINGTEETGSIHLTGHIQRIGQNPSTFTSWNIPIHYNTFYQPVDLNGDGKTDFAYEDGGKLWGIYSNGSSFSAPVLFGNVSLAGANRNMSIFSPYEYRFHYGPNSTSPLASNRPAADFFADMNGDELTDFVHANGGSFSIYINRETYFDNPIVIAGGNDFFLNAMVDITGDGKADYLQLIQTYDNPTLSALQSQKAALDTLMAQYQAEHTRAKSVADSLPVSTTGDTISEEDFQEFVAYLDSNGNSFLADYYELNGSTFNYDSVDLANLQTALENIVSAKMNFVGEQSYAINAQIGAIYAQGTVGQATYALQIRSFNLSNGTSQVNTYSMSNSVDPEKSTLADVNGDGVLDFVSFTGTQSVVSIFMGNGFSNPIVTNLNASNGKNLSQFNFGEVNGDGLSDLVLFNRESQRFETYLSNGNGNFTLNNDYSFGGFSPQEYTDSNGIERGDQFQISLQDMNLDGISDLSLVFLNVGKTMGKVYYRYSSARNSGEDLLQVASNASGNQSSRVQYALTNQHPGATQPGTGNYPNVPNVSSGFLVVQSEIDMSTGNIHRKNYSYSNLRYNQGTRGVARSLGFASIRETDVNTGFYKITDFFQNDYRLSGSPQSERNYNASDNILRSTVYSAHSFPNPFGTEIAVPGSVTFNLYQNGNLLTSSAKSVVYDSYGFTTSDSEVIGSHSITNTTQYLHDTTTWRIGRAVRSRKNVDGTWVEDSQFYYTGDNLTSKTQFPASSSPLTTTFGYDSYGNVISVNDPSSGLSTITYDPVLNHFPISKTNALGHVTTASYDFATGLELSIVDPNGAVTSTNYDAYGRKLSVIYPGESSPNETYQYDNTGIYDVNNHTNNESVAKSVRDTVSGSENVSKIYRDPFGNTIRTENNTAVSGVNTIEEFQFDYSIGKLIRKSLPYLSVQTPQYVMFQYNHPDGDLSSMVEPASMGSILTTVSKSGYTEAKSTTYPDGQTESRSETINELGQTVSRTENGRTISFVYSPFGEVRTITDVSGVTTNITYDSIGRRISTQDPNSGIISFGYDSQGRISSQTDARGKSIQFTYDALGRILTQNTNGGEASIQFTYDDASVPFSKGRLTKVVDESGQAEFRFNQRGETIQKTKVVDDIVAIFKTDYDSLGRVATNTYPDGTKLHTLYTPTGSVSNITMDSADGTSVGHSVVRYEGPTLNGNGDPVVRRVTGNGVTMEIAFEPTEQKPLALTTRKPDGTMIGNVEYSYDGKGQLTRIEDKLNPSRSQNFTLDNFGRVTHATGKYGSHVYSYSANGNLLQKGNYTLSYGDPQHANAVTTASSANTGTLNYSYDASGNMTNRNGDVLRYDSYGKLIEMTPNGTAEMIRYFYDYTGSRIKSITNNSLTTSYFFGSDYEIVRNSGIPERHTLYVKGIQGETVAQLTREDATLLLGESVGDPESVSMERYSIGMIVSNVVGASTAPFCKDVAGDCGNFYKNRMQGAIVSIFSNSSYFQGGVPTHLYNAIYFLILLVFFYFAYPYFLRGNELLQNLSWRGAGTPAVIVAVFVMTSLPGCGILPGTGSKEGDPPWLLAMGSNVNSGTPNIQNPGINSSGGGEAGGTPVNGMFFYHPDHLGSVTMITDGYGNPASGPEPGVSYVSYEPYGSINRNDSYGPDIFRYKYTGQSEDKETGLYFYKSRYYDPVLGRYLQADSVVDPHSVNGQNRYMYVEGNPVGATDPSGHSLDLMFYAALYQYAQLPNNPQKESNNLMLLYLHNQQIRNTSGPGCPVSGKNSLVWGNFQGAGLCGGKLPKQVMEYMLIALSRADLGPTVALAYYFLNKPNSALTIIDRSGIAHDEEHDWSSSKQALHANEEWIKQSWGNFYSINEQRAAYNREYDALPKSYDRYGGTGKSIIAGVNYAGTTLVDMVVLPIGTSIFASQNIIGYQLQFAKSATFVKKGRYNNFWKPNKWKL